MEYKYPGRVEYCKRIISWVIMLGVPLVSYLSFEWITGSLTSIHGHYHLLNLTFYYMFYLTLFAVTGCFRISYLCLNVGFTILAIAEYFVMSFRTRPIMAGDLSAVGTAFTVSGNYNYEITSSMVQACAVMLFISVFVCLFPVRIKKRKYHLWSAGICCMVTASWFFIFYHGAADWLGVSINMWTPEQSYQEMGYVLSTMRTMGYMNIKEPEGYSVQALKRLEEELSQQNSEEGIWSSDTKTVPKNIICIMNESYSDLRKVGAFKTDQEFMTFYDSLKTNCIKGDLYMPIWGSMTCNSEFEVLTGNALAYTPSGSVPYQLYMDQISSGLTNTLKSQGFHTIAIHPYYRTNWNRPQAYASLGFDEFLDIEEFGGSELVRNYVSDKATYDKIIELTTAKNPEDDLFIFNVTMQNHGGYEEEYESTVHLTELEGYPKTEQYLSLIRESDLALEYLLDYYSQIDDPTMIIMFGDHQPSIEQEFYEALYGTELSQLGYDELMKRYITPLLIWTNYDMPSEEIPKMSALYLSNVILERGNLEITEFQRFTDKMYQAVPVVHPFGYYRKNGDWEDWENWELKEDYPLLQVFGYLQYNNMFGRKNRIDSLFFKIKED